jgi:hypothetical protein
VGRRLHDYLGSLSADDRSQLEEDAIAAEDLRRAIDSGDETLVAEYKNVILRRHLLALPQPLAGSTS